MQSGIHYVWLESEQPACDWDVGAAVHRCQHIRHEGIIVVLACLIVSLCFSRDQLAAFVSLLPHFSRRLYN